jgi:hypothetical protein
VEAGPMRIPLVPCWLPILVAPAAGCGLLEPGDGPASVSWVEARFAGSDLQLRAVGSTGCGRLTGVFAHVQGPTVVVYARATRVDFQCLAPLTYDATVSVPAPGPGGDPRFHLADRQPI